MKGLCLIINNREFIPEDSLSQLHDGVRVVWYQKTGPAFLLKEALAAAPTADILITPFLDLNASALSSLPALRAIIATTVATDFIDLEYCKDRQIRVFNTPRYTGSSVAEYALALMLAALRHIPDVNNAVRAGDDQCFSYVGTELAGKRAGVIGFGDIGSRVARFAAAFDMDVVFVNRSPRQSPIARQVDLATLLSTSDVVFLTLPLNGDSRMLLGEPELNLLRDGALVVSISPDEVIDRDALAAALRTRRIRATLDVHRGPAGLLNVPNLIMSPRRAWYTTEAFQRRVATWRSTLARYIANEPPPSVV
jgi:phosphoglycerate dehydrogenase-like enzyme